MKKKLMVLLLTLMTAMLVVSPVVAAPDPADGAPGWSHENSGNGSSAKPGKGA